jgi:hypothetical protein
MRDIGEWHQNKLHGTVKQENPLGINFWGKFKNDKKEGFGMIKWTDGAEF